MEPQNIKISFFFDKVFVTCVNCSNLGIITSNIDKNKINIPENYEYQFVCTSCNLVKKNTKDWYGFYVGSILRACKSCGSNLGFLTKPTKNNEPTKKVTCTTCNHENEYEINWTKYRNEKATDPFLGMDLWLQTSIKSNILWVYNLEHLNFLKNYIGSKIRDGKNRHKYSLITNLPNWIKSAKNRELIVKKLAILESDLLKIYPNK